METKIINTTPAGLRELLAAVPESGTREQLVYIDVDDLAPDPKNFYSLSDMEGLMSNIALFGVQQPLRVRDDPEDLGRYVIVSGHRRREAVRRLVEEDEREDLRELPCIVEAITGSEALRELRLIYGNSDTRKMTGAEISEQARRVEELLYQLKEEGYDFPGRMRDHVAEACRVSKSKLSRLKVIREKLHPAVLEHWKQGYLAESVAYAMAQISQEDQGMILSYSSYGVKDWSELLITDYRNDIKKIRETNSRARCGQETCTFQAERIEGRLHENRINCAGGCCWNCGWAATSCNHVCPHAEEHIARKQAEARAKDEERKKLVEEQMAKIRQAHAEDDKRDEERKCEQMKFAQELWSRFNEARVGSGVGYDAILAELEIPASYQKQFEECETNGPETALELPYDTEPEGLMDVCKIARLFGVTTDWLLGVSDEPEGGGTAWRTGKPSAAGRYYARFDPEAPVELACRWTGESWQGPFGNTIEHACCGWVPLPEKE